MTLRRTAEAGFWSTIELLAGQIVNFVAIIFLARILSPTDFGVFAFVVLAVAFSGTLITGGLSALIIQRNNLTAKDLDRIFTLALLLSLGLGAIIAALGPLLAYLYGFEALAVVMPAVCLHPLIVSLGLVQSALCNKHLRFAPLAKVVLISGLSAGIVAVILAYYGFGIWALAAQMLLSAMISSALMWRIGDVRPSLTGDLMPLMPHLRFAAPVSVTQAVQIFYAQGAALIIGKRFSAADVGLFNRGYGIALLPGQLFNGLVGKVALPLFSELGDDNEAIRHGMKRGSESIMIISAPAFVGLAALAPQLLELLYGAKWVGAAPVLAIFALSGLMMPIQSTNVHLLLAKGMSRTFFRLQMVQKAIGILFVIIGSFYGITYVALGYTAAGIVALYLNTRHTRTILGLGLIEQLQNVAGIMAAALIMGGVVWLFTDFAQLPLIVETLAGIVIGVATYLLFGFASGGASFRRVFQDAKNLLMRPQ